MPRFGSDNVEQWGARVICSKNYSRNGPIDTTNIKLIIFTNDYDPIYLIFFEKRTPEDITKIVRHLLGIKEDDDNKFKLVPPIQEPVDDNERTFVKLTRNKFTLRGWRYRIASGVHNVENFTVLNKSKTRNHDINQSEDFLKLYEILNKDNFLDKRLVDRSNTLDLEHFSDLGNFNKLVKGDKTYPKDKCDFSQVIRVNIVDDIIYTRDIVQRMNEDTVDTLTGERVPLLKFMSSNRGL
jgi:hypothetical protein